MTDQQYYHKKWGDESFKWDAGCKLTGLQFSVLFNIVNNLFTFLTILGTRILFFFCFFVVEIIYLHFENLIQKIYQYTACEQALLSEFRENFAHLLCFHWLVSWQPESWEIQKSTARVQAHFSPLNWHKRDVLANQFIYGGVSQLLIYLDILVRFFLIIYPHQ